MSTLIIHGLAQMTKDLLGFAGCSGLGGSAVSSGWSSVGVFIKPWRTPFTVSQLAYC